MITETTITPQEDNNITPPIAETSQMPLIPPTEDSGNDDVWKINLPEDDNDSKQDEGAKNTTETKQSVDNTPKEETSKKDDAPKTSYDFKSKFGDDFDSEEKIAEVLKSYNDLKTKAQKAEMLESLPEHNKGLVEFVAKGGDAKTYIEAMSKDYDKMDSKAVIREAFMLENKAALAKKGFSDKHIELKFEQEFKAKFGLEPYDEDIHDEEYKDLYEMSKIELDSYATELKEELKEQQKQALKTPQAKQEDEKKFWLDTVAKASKEFNGLTVKVAGEDISFKNESPETIRDTMAGMNYNPQEHAKAVFLAKYFDKIIAEVDKKATEKGYKKGIEEVQKKLANPQKIANNNDPKSDDYSERMTYQEANEIARTQGIRFLN